MLLPGASERGKCRAMPGKGIAGMEMQSSEPGHKTQCHGSGVLLDVTERETTDTPSVAVLLAAMPGEKVR
jgi:hypothetical protein